MLLQHQAPQPRAVLACPCPAPVRLPWGPQGGFLPGQCLICVCPGGSVGGRGACSRRRVLWGPPRLWRRRGGTMSRASTCVGCWKAPVCCASSLPVVSALPQMLSFGPSSRAVARMGAHPGNCRHRHLALLPLQGGPELPSPNLCGRLTTLEGLLPFWPLQNFPVLGPPPPPAGPLSLHHPHQHTKQALVFCLKLNIMFGDMPDMLDKPDTKGQILKGPIHERSLGE